MNRGIVVGALYDLDGRPVKGAEVIVWRMFAGSGPHTRIEKFESKTNKNGEFSAAFLWPPVEWADDLSVVTLQVHASTNEGDLLKDGYSRTTGFTVRKIRGYIARDILHPINVASGNPFSSFSDLADFAIGIGQALTNYKSLVPFWKVSQVASTEGWVIGAGAKLYLDNVSA